MKKLLLLPALISLLLSGCSNQKEQIPQITLNDSTCIRIIADNIVDTITVNTRFCSHFPFRHCLEKSISITKPGIYYITYRMTKPELIKFEIGSSFQSLLIPGDTMDINVGFTSNEDKIPAIYYKTTNVFYDYYQSKKEKFGYYSLADIDGNPVLKFHSKMEISVQAYNEALNTLSNSAAQNVLFLDKNKKNLPDWFIDLEKANITYGSALKALELYNMLKPDDKKNTPFIKVEFNNTKAHLSALYYYFLYEYLNYKYPIENIDLSFVNNRANQFIKSSHFVDSTLNGETRDYFIICRLADLYYFSLSNDDLKQADKFITDFYPVLTEDKIKFLQSEKAHVIKFLGIKSNLSNGDKAPRFYLKDVNGTPYELSNFRGKLVYLHFWATWCEPCRKEIPVLNQLYSELNKNSVAIVNICLDDNLNKWKKIIEKDKLNGINLICKGSWEKSLKDQYFISEVPHFTLVDQNGIIITNKCNGPGKIYPEILRLLDKK